MNKSLKFFKTKISDYLVKIGNLFKKAVTPCIVKIGNLFKKVVTAYLKKKLTGRPQHYYFYRWLADLVEDKDRLDDACYGISKWALINPVNGKIFRYIRDVFVLDNIVYIYTERPGLLIGKKGCTCNEIIQEINNNSEINYTISVIEMWHVSLTSILTYIVIDSENETFVI